MAYRTRTDIPIAKLEGGSAGYDPQARRLGERHHEIFGNALGEVIVSLCGIEGCEGQHRDGCGSVPRQPAPGPQRDGDGESGKQHYRQQPCSPPLTGDCAG